VSRRPHACRGQALAEFITGATLFLIPVFLIIPLLGKYADMKGAVVQASRYNAWERTVWYGQSASSSGDWDSNDKSESDIKNDMATRFFNNALNSALWKDRAGSPMMANYSNLISNEPSPSTADAVLGFVVTALDMIGDFRLETDGLYAGTATLNTAAITPIGQVIERSGTQTWEALNLAVSDKNVILANGWSAKGADHVKTQVKGLMPLGFFDNDVFNVLRWAMVVFTPEVVPTVLEAAKVEPDEVPTDRLKP
jgi:hypothetical protein